MVGNAAEQDSGLCVDLPYREGLLVRAMSGMGSGTSYGVQSIGISDLGIK